MSLSLNPCKACWEKYKRGNCNINTVNNCVTSTAAAFAGIPSNNFIRDTPADENWKSCMEKMMSAEGRAPCNFQLDMAPVWNQVPHNFPNLLVESGNPEKAKKQCMLMCSESRYPNECRENCITDAAAVESYKPQNLKYEDNEYDEARKGNPVIFWVAFVITALMLAFILSVFYISLYSRKIGR
jgi:hypothetical protein